MCYSILYRAPIQLFARTIDLCLRTQIYSIFDIQYTRMCVLFDIRPVRVIWLRFIVGGIFGEREIALLRVSVINIYDCNRLRQLAAASYKSTAGSRYANKMCLSSKRMSVNV
jgi:hypothetical protein